MADRVLVVDDEKDLVASFERLLRRQGYDVIAQDTRQGGLATIEREPLVLVISDLRLPDGNGLDVVLAARRAPTPIPAMVVTGFGSAASRQAALGAGAFAYLAKPFATADFTAAVAEALGHQSRRADSRRPPPRCPRWPWHWRAKAAHADFRTR